MGAGQQRLALTFVLCLALGTGCAAVEVTGESARSRARLEEPKQVRVFDFAVRRDQVPAEVASAASLSESVEDLPGGGLEDRLAQQVVEVAALFLTGELLQRGLPARRAEASGLEHASPGTLDVTGVFLDPGGRHQPVRVGVGQKLVLELQVSETTERGRTLVESFELEARGSLGSPATAGTSPDSRAWRERQERTRDRARAVAEEAAALIEELARREGWLDR